MHIHDEIYVMILCCHVGILHLNLGQNLRVDKTCFLRPGHILNYEISINDFEFM